MSCSLIREPKKTIYLNYLFALFPKQNSIFKINGKGRIFELFLPHNSRCIVCEKITNRTIDSR
nr:MAG TPA: hypothetical protein [Caudoviricetes sp.]